LRDVDVRARCLGSPPVIHVLYLADQRATCLLDGRNERTWISEREHESVRLVAQGEFDDLLRGVPGEMRNPLKYRRRIRYLLLIPRHDTLRFLKATFNVVVADERVL
jgi:hypothetical protein